MKLIVPIQAALVILSLSFAAAGQDRQSGLELSGYAGWGRMIAPQVEHSHEIDATNGGIEASALLLYHSSHILSPYLETGYARLYSSRERIDLGTELGVVETSSFFTTFWLAAGPALDLGPLRIRGGLGMYQLRVDSTVDGVRIRPSELDLGWFASVSGFPFQYKGISFGPECRLLLISEASTAAIGIGITGRGDLLKW
jgi:hypothetical protein